MDENSDLIALTIDVVAAFVGQNNMRPEDVPAFIASTHAAIAQLKAVEQGGVSAEPVVEHVPAVSVRKSLASKEHILSLIDGKPYKTLRRHLTKHGLTPEQYRARYKLPDSYPMVAENYSAHRRELANKSGLGKRIVPTSSGRASAPTPETAAEPVATRPTARRRKANGNGAVAPSEASVPTARAKVGRAKAVAAPATGKGGRKAKEQPEVSSPKAASKPKKRLSLKLVSDGASRDEPA